VIFFEQFSMDVSSTPNLILPYELINEWNVVDTFPIGSSDNGLCIKTEQTTYFFQVQCEAQLIEPTSFTNAASERDAICLGWPAA
jgi:hypothetical protein